MLSKKVIFRSIVVMLLLILGAVGRAEFENGALAGVTLTSFTAVGGDGQVLLEWETASEINNIGFNLWRSTSETGSYVKLNASLIPSQALGSVVGAYYSYTDSDVINGTTYYYKLESVDTNGSSEFHGPITATPEGQPTATPTPYRVYLPLALKDYTAGAVPTPTATPHRLYLPLIVNNCAPPPSLKDACMSDTPYGPAVINFPSGVGVVYTIVEYENMRETLLGVRTYDNVGNVLFEQMKRYNGSGVESVRIASETGIFADGRYVTNIYVGATYRGDYPFLAKTLLWAVGGEWQ
jgi:hypothetical protein